MGKQKNHGVYSPREWSGFFANLLASKLADVFSKTPPSRQAGRAPCFFWTPILGNFFISRKARKAGPLAKRVSDVFSQSRASSLVKGFEKAAPAWLAQAPPCAFPIRVYPRHQWFKTHNPVQASLQMSFQKPRHLGKPGVPRVFSGSQFLAISSSRARREKQGCSRSE